MSGEARSRERGASGTVTFVGSEQVGAGGQPFEASRAGTW